MQRTKYNISKDTEKRTHNSIVFDSVMEMKYYRDVVLPQVESGNIVEFELQKPYILQPKFIRNSKTVQPIIYIADFYIKFLDGKEAVVDVKGCPDSLSKLKRKMFFYVYPNIDYQWMTLSAIDGGWQTFEYVTKQRKERKKNREDI